MTHVVCGVDVSSETLDARVGRDGASESFARTPEGIAALIAFCRAHAVTLVAMEATGGYERLPFSLLWEAGLATAILHPLAVRRFAEAMGFLEKTDRIDAGIIAWFAEARRVVPQPPPGETQRRLTALTTRLRQLTELRAMQIVQRRHVEDAAVLASIEAVMALLSREIGQFEAEIASLIDDDPLWRELDQAFRSIKGVADRTVATVMAEIPQIGTLSNKAVAKLAGLAPLANDSGKSSGKRAVRGGRSSVRAILFVVADIVRRFDQDFAAFHRKLRNAGKPPKLVRIALARKLLVRLNAKARDTRQQLANAT